MSRPAAAVLLLVLAAPALAAPPLTDAWAAGEAIGEASAPLPSLAAAPAAAAAAVAPARYFSLELRVRAPTFDDPPRLPRCLAPRHVARWLARAVSASAPAARHAAGRGNVSVACRLLQRGADCTHGCSHVFAQPLDHANASDGRRFNQTYWTCDAAWRRGGPASDAQPPRPRPPLVRAPGRHVLVFLGNESPLGLPGQPIVFENAARLNALVLLVEHRAPTAAAAGAGRAPSTEDYHWLTIENVVADTAAVLAHVRASAAVPEAVPAIVIGGSYGGMLAAYHRVAAPHVFAAAVASSAPVDYVFGTRMWADAAERYHERIAASLAANSGGPACGAAMRAGLEEIAAAGRSAAGRRRLAAAFGLCPRGAAALEAGGPRAAAALLRDQYGNAHGWAQTNGQPPLTDGCCTQGVETSGELPATGAPDSATPRYGAPRAALAAECASTFGPAVPPLRAPGFARDIKRLVLQHGGIVFTNGELDGWAGGSIWGPADLEDGGGGAAAASRRLAGRRGGVPPAGDWLDERRRLGFVMYRGAAHCTDTHVANWANPLPAEARYRAQRARAMDWAARLAAGSARGAAAQ
ncbi:hypothetical protein HT031_004743 [Scenedesmus sp. PABB004]|nr:hypothetical protein HT031_004743 [Scenedesmus sp. PABB004]